MAAYLRDSGAGADQLLAGMVGQQMQKMDRCLSSPSMLSLVTPRFVVQDVTDFLFVEFGEDTANRGGKDFGADLVARNLQRGRDHGLPPYTEFRRLCGLGELSSSWKSQPKEIPREAWEVLAGLYRY